MFSKILQSTVSKAADKSRDLSRKVCFSFKNESSLEVLSIGAVPVEWMLLKASVISKRVSFGKKLEFWNIDFSKNFRSKMKVTNWSVSELFFWFHNF